MTERVGTRGKGKMAGNIASLAIDEAVRIDGRRVNEIVAELGSVAAENVIGMALEQLAKALERVREAAGRNETGQVAYHADRLSRLAWQLGLTSLAGVAVDVCSCIDNGDVTGTEATLARLLRVGTRSLTDIWNEQDPR